MPDEVISAVIEQAQEIGKLEADTEQQEELLEELGEKVEQLEAHDLSDRRWLNEVENRIYNLERELEEWKNKPQAVSEPETEETESLTEEVLTIPIPEVEEPAKEVARKKGFLNWLF